MSFTSVIEVRRPPRFVSRGGAKLQSALERFQIHARGRVCVDLGTSTGGFVDCLLQNGAVRVYAFDVGRGQIAWSLATDPRVELRDRANVRYLQPEDIAEPFFLMTVDLSFISLRLVLPAIAGVFQKRADPDGTLLLLVKPQFELSADRIAPGGLVRDVKEGEKAVQKVIQAAEDLGFADSEIFPSPLKGAEGNQEYFVRLHLRSQN